MMLSTLFLLLLRPNFTGYSYTSVVDLACHRCNGRRYNFTEGIDPETHTVVPIFNARQNKWSEHFIWSDKGQKILGITAMGRATIERLDMNDERHDDGAIQRARRFWIRGGWHPPTHDPRQ